MTEERLSRRARRAQEETPHADPAAEFAARVQAGEVPELGPDGHVLSRRERRRLERVVHPVESWTAQEEMIATGQIPAVTPDVIAEQERLARDKAAQAQAEAVAASAEMRLVAATEARPDRLAEVTGQVEQVAAVEPVQPVVEQVPAAPPVLEEPSTDPSPVPASLRHLFPPGSLQARAFEEQEAKAAAQAQEVDYAQPQPSADEDDAAAEIRRLAAAAMANLERSAHEEAAPVPSGATAEPSPFEEALAAAEAAVAAATPVDMGAHSAPVPVVPAPVENPFGEVGPGGIAGDALTEVMAVPAFEQEVPVVEPDPLPVVSEPIPAVSLPDPASSGSVPSVPAPSSQWDEHPLDAAPAASVDVNAYTPVADLPTPDLAALQQAQSNPFAPVGSGQFGGPQQAAPHPFGQPPFTQSFEAAPPQQSALFPGQPLTGQTPIFPGALGGANPSTGAIPLVNGAVPTMPGQLLTGSVPTVNREARLQEAGGVRHYRWVHFVVLGALMFVFGVVMYQVIRVNT